MNKGVFSPGNADEARQWFDHVRAIGAFFWSHNQERKTRFIAWVDSLGNLSDNIRVIRLSENEWDYSLRHGDRWRELQPLLEAAMRKPPASAQT